MSDQVLVEKPTVSVVMSVRNGGIFLADCVQSILGQTLTNFEFIIINDNSSDNTKTILEDYADRDRRIRIINDSEHRNHSQSLNKAIAASSGKWIARMDADDVSLPTRLQKEKEFMEEHLETGLVGTGFLKIDEKGKTIEKIQHELNESQIRKLLIRGNIFCHSSIMMKRSALENVGYYNNHLTCAEDYDLYLKILKHFQISLIREPLHLWRVHSHNTSTLKSREQATVVLKIQVLAIQNGLYPPWNYIHLIRSILSFFITSPIKQCLAKVFSRPTDWPRTHPNRILSPHKP